MTRPLSDFETELVRAVLWCGLIYIVIVIFEMARAKGRRRKGP